MCVCLCVYCPGCISSDKVLLNMFAEGPQKEKGPLTQEGLEPQRLRGRAHTHAQAHTTHTRLANTTFKSGKKTT